MTPTVTVTPTPSATATPRTSECPLSLPPDCKTGTAGAGSLSIKIDAGDPAKSKITWKWVKGTATSLAELGDPSTTNNFLLCIYDGTEAPVLRLLVPAGGTCGKKPCWKAGEKGYSYTKKGALPGKVKLTVGKQTTGSANMAVQGSGASLTGLALPFTMPVRALLLNDSTSATWCATYAAPASSSPLSTIQWRDKNE